MRLDLFREDHQKTHLLNEAHHYRAVVNWLQSRKSAYTNSDFVHRGAYHYTLASALSRIGDYKEADHHFDLALAIVPGDRKIKLEMAESYLQRGTLKDAEKLLLEIHADPNLERSPLNRRFHILAGKYFKLTGDYATARQNYAYAHDLRTHDRGPSKDVVLMDDFMETADYHLGNTRGALEYAHHLSCIDARENPHTDLTLTFLRNSFKHFKRVDDKLHLLASLAQYSLKFNKISDAVRYNEQALALDGNHARSLATRIRMLFAVGNKEEALERYHSDLNLISDDPRAALTLAITFRIAGLTDISHKIGTRLLNQRDTAIDTRESARLLIADIDALRERQFSQN